MSIHFLLVDGFNLVRRVFEAHKATNERELTEVIKATCSWLQRALAKYTPSHAAVVFEEHDKTWRHLLYPEYKGNRSPTPELLLNNLEKFVGAYASLDVVSISIASYEADDVIATMARVVADHQGQATILSTDKIFLQLIAQEIRVVDHFAEKEFDPEYVQERFGVTVAQYIDYLSLVGDKSNNIKGVPGVGAVTAASLLQSYGSLSAMFAADESDTALKKLKGQAQLATRCQQLITLKQDVRLGQNLKHFRLPVH